ncbi:MAG: hypothetical protein V4550_03490 [Gemmatimonadota bacterium]
MVIVRVFGRRALVIVALLVAPRWFVPTPTNAQAESAIRAYWGRQASAEWMPRMQSAPPESARATAASMGDAMRDARERTIVTLAVRRSIIGPPFASRWTYYVRLKRATSSGYEYFRIRGGYASPESRASWRVPLF